MHAAYDHPSFFHKMDIEAYNLADGDDIIADIAYHVD
jgi:hypothetical protein